MTAIRHFDSPVVIGNPRERDQAMSVGSLPIKHRSLALLLAASAIALSPASQAADAAALRVVKDPVTGQLRAPTPEEFKAMQEQEARERALTRSAAPTGPVLRRAANGAVGYRVGEAFMSFSVAKRNADGTVTMQCVPGAEAADKLLTAPQSSTAPTDKEHGHADQ